jgi:UDP-N-acetylmuramoyl-L-alanyl-D-glutamate--2,6-diaminopimelate ligase
MQGVSNPYTVVENRKEAIRWAIENAQPQDIILLAGKGMKPIRFYPRHDSL